MKFRSKPVEIEAEQFLPDEKRPWPKGVNHSSVDGSSISGYAVWTPRGKVEVKPGDWIIQEPGFAYPCADEVFKQKYEAVE